MIHPDLAEGAAAIRACCDAAEDSGRLDEMARLALPVVGGGLALALMEMTLYLLDAEVLEPH